MPNLEDLIAGRSTRQRHTSKAAREEAQRRRIVARDLAKSALLTLYHDDYSDLYQQALVKVNNDLGPLPE